MLKKLLRYLTLPLLVWLGNSSGDSASQATLTAPEGFSPGPDVIAGNMADLDVYGADGTQRGLAVGLTTCNGGDQLVGYFAIPGTDHPAVASNLYRMSGGSNNNDQFEQIGQSWVKHTFGAKQANSCNFGCRPGGDFTHLGVGCSDTYFASQSAEQNDLGSRAWINPFTGVFPSTARDHTGHTHTGTSHMILTEDNDLNPAMNPSATYYAELLYVTPDEYAWCQTHPGQCNMNNNASYRQYSIAGTAIYLFFPVDSTVRMSPAINAWTGATINPIEPDPGNDGRAFIAYKVTGPIAGIWHYEYAIYNQNLDRAIQSFSVPLGCGITVSNLGFHAPLNHPGFPQDGTQGDAGFSNATWTSNQAADTVTWNTETFAQNPNANAIRWGTLYNFRFDSDHSPITKNATIGFFKTGTPVTVSILGPDACKASTPTPTPGPAAQALNLSTRVLVRTGDGVGIGGFIITGTVPKLVLLRALGPSLAGSGVPNPLADPVLELHGPPGFGTIINDNCADSTPLPPPGCKPGSLEAAIEVPLDPGAYTAIIRGKNDSSGVGLVEINDFDQQVDSRLANLSTRAFVNTGNEIVIAGFLLGGNSADSRIVARGLGPSLASSGVSNALANPTLELRNSNGAVVVANDNWQDDPTQAAELMAAGLAPTDSHESGIVSTLAPGAYTALLSGVNSGTGLGLVEVYNLGPP